MTRVRQITTARPSRIAAAAATFALAFATVAVAPVAQAADGDRPARGLTMSQVEARYGAPAERSTAVGQPPITRWEYPGLVVYFESDRVVHAVVTGAAPPAAAPAETPAGQ